MFTRLRRATPLLKAMREMVFCLPYGRTAARPAFAGLVAQLRRAKWPYSAFRNCTSKISVELAGIGPTGRLP